VKRELIKKLALMSLGSLLLLGVQCFCFAATTNVSVGKTLTIQSAVDIALQNSLKRRVALADVKIAANQAAQASAGYMPKINLAGGVSRLKETPDLVKLGRDLAALNNAMGQLASSVGANELAAQLGHQEGPDDGLTYYGLKLKLEQPLYTGGYLNGINAQARANLLRAKYALEKAEAELVLDVKKAFYQVLYAQSIMDSVHHGMISMENHVNEAKQFFEAGIVAKLDVIRAEVALTELEQQSLQAENSLKTARMNLNYVLGVNLDECYVLTQTDAEPSFDGTLNGCVARAEKNRAELKEMDAGIEMSKSQVQIAKSGNRPSVGLVMEYDQYDTKAFSGDEDLTISLLASFNLWDGGLVKNRVLEAQNKRDQMNSTRELLKNGIRLEVEQAFNNLQNALQLIRVAGKNLRQAEEVLKMAQESYQAGLTTSLERIDAETGLVHAQNSFYQAQINYQIMSAELQRVIN
jgi:outer membrane protein